MRAHTQDKVPLCSSKLNTMWRFFDPTFYFDKQENLFPPGTPDDCTVGLPEKCVRLSELFGEDCEVFVEAKDGEDDDPVDASDIVQGSIGSPHCKARCCLTLQGAPLWLALTTFGCPGCWQPAQKAEAISDVLP